ncbi:MAG: flagellar hook-basal body complex subunit FliE [Bryobacterales bacterium]|nr:flagellar hook-basal body complex subunit FliE [Bryobacterales bacterium]
MPIQPIQPPSIPDIQTTISKASGAGDFRDLLASSIASVEQQQHEAQTAVNNFLTGESEDLHTAALAGQRAELSLQLFMQVRNKVVSAYQEVMRMQV